MNILHHAHLHFYTYCDKNTRHFVEDILKFLFLSILLYFDYVFIGIFFLYFQLKISQRLSR